MINGQISSEKFFKETSQESPFFISDAAWGNFRLKLEYKEIRL